MIRHTALTPCALFLMLMLLAGVACGSGGQDGGTPDVGSDAGQGRLPTIRLTPAYPQLSFRRPIYLTHAGDGTDRVFVVEQSGRIRVFENRRNVSRAPVFLDIREQVYRRHNEEGLLGLAFHPDYAENGHFYVYYSASEPRRGVISRFSVSNDDPNRADPSSEKVILEVAQPWGNHNGSTVLFGPDGMLYISLGDGGSANDPHNNGQDLSTLLATVLRIDVDHAENGRAYSIPDDNPFVDREGARPEIWAYGLRNIWRMSFDRETGDLWGGDVGQNKWEEIDLIVSGGNYGWRVREGRHPFKQGDMPDPPIDPVAEYPRGLGLSVTGGYVYRGTEMDRLIGAYLYADYVTGRIWAFRHEDGVVTAQREIYSSNRRPAVASFGEDRDGELYICGFDRVDGDEGTIYKIEQSF